MRDRPPGPVPRPIPQNRGRRGSPESETNGTKALKQVLLVRRLAASLVISRRQKEVRAKGRKPTVDGLASWALANAAGAFNDVIGEAARAAVASGLTPRDGVEMYLSAMTLHLLLEVSVSKRARPGRPGKVGLFQLARIRALSASGSSLQRGGRPRALDPKAEIKFSAYVLGVKLGLYARLKGLGPVSNSAIEVLVREARAFGAAAADHLHETISDREAARELARQGFAPGSVHALCKRIARARDRSPAHLPGRS